MIENYVIEEKRYGRAYAKVSGEPSDGSLFVYDDEFEKYFNKRYRYLFISPLNWNREDVSLLNLALSDKANNIGLWEY